MWLHNTADGVYRNTSEEQWDILYLLNPSFDIEVNVYTTLDYLNLAGTMDNHLLDVDDYYFSPEYWSSCQDKSFAYILGKKGYRYAKEHLLPIDGDYYIAMLQNADGQNGTLSQELISSLLPNATYEISFNLAHSEYFMHKSDTTSTTKYSQDVPAILRLWSSEDGCDLRELLYESEAISNEEWRKTKVSISPIDSVRYLVFEVVADGVGSKSTNLLMDDISKIKLVGYSSQ